MATTSRAIPIVLCGAKVALGMESAKFMRPQYEVIHFCCSVEAACAELPRLLSNEAPAPAEDNEVGTHNYSAIPQAVLVGRTYTDDKLQAVQDACKGKGAISWVVPGEPAKKDETIAAGHAVRVATNMKNVLNDLSATGQMGKDVSVEYEF